jgi:hypothetical protein
MRPTQASLATISGSQSWTSSMVTSSTPRWLRVLSSQMSTGGGSASHDLSQIKFAMRKDHQRQARPRLNGLGYYAFNECSSRLAAMSR